MAKRRGRHEGSVYEYDDPVRGPRWIGQIDLGRDQHGKRRRARVYGETREAVSARLIALLHQHRNERRMVVTERETVGQFLTRWLADVAKHSVRPSTYRSYEQLIRLHLVPGLGHLRLRDLTPAHVTWLLREKHTEGRVPRRPRAMRAESEAGEQTAANAAPNSAEAPRAGLSPRTVRMVRDVLRIALNQAVAWDLIAKNPAVAAKLPKLTRFRCEPLTAEQAKALIASLDAHTYRALFVVALTTGLRQGELLAVRWEDVDLEAGELRVRHTLQRVDRAYRLLPPKTESSVRTVPLPDMTVEALRRHKREQAKARLLVGAEWANTLGLVFTSPVGKPLDGVNVTHMLKRVLRAAKLPAQRFHDLRHATASFLLVQGVQVKVVAEVLGHADTRTTANLYQHVLQSVKRDAADRLAEALA